MTDVLAAPIVSRAAVDAALRGVLPAAVQRRTGMAPLPILTLLRTTGTIESLATMRAHILEAVASGELVPSEKTFREWQEAIWVRVLELMALRPRQAPYILNVVFTWPKPAALHDVLEAQMHECFDPLPSDAEVLALQGIEIVGVTKVERVAEVTL